MNRDFRLLVLMGLAALLAGAEEARADVRIPIGVKINGTPVHLAFDTGAGVPLTLFTDAAAQLGLKVVPPLPGPPEHGKLIPGYTEPTAFQFAGRVYPDTRFAVLDTRVPLDIIGLMGWPFVDDAVVVLKIADSSVDLTNRVPEEVTSWQQFPLIPGSDTLQVKLGKGRSGQEIQGLIDTGDDGGVTLPPDLWHRWRAAHANLRGTITAKYSPAEGILVDEVVQASEITIGGLTLHDVPVEGPETAPLLAADAGKPVTLGLAALARVDIVTDGPGGIFYAKPRTEVQKAAFTFNRLGGVFVGDLNGSDDLVAHIAAGGPAEKAGIRNGDLLLKIDALDVTPWRRDPSILPFAKYWEQPAGTKLVLTLKRAGKVVTAEVVLVDLVVPFGTE